MEKMQENDLTVGNVNESVLAWKVHLLKEDPKKALLVFPAVLVSLAICYIFFRNPIPMIAVLFLFFSSFSDYFFPIMYSVDEKGASVKTALWKNFLEWEKVKKYYLDETGIKLSTLGYPSRLEAFRGIYLRFGGNKEEVIEAVRRLRDAGKSGGT
jgi:hypothetical protein